MDCPWLGLRYRVGDYPVVIVQDDAFAARDSILVCLITTDSTDLPVFRVLVQALMLSLFGSAARPIRRTGLQKPRWMPSPTPRSGRIWRRR